MSTFNVFFFSLVLVFYAYERQWLRNEEEVNWTKYIWQRLCSFTMYCLCSKSIGKTLLQFTRNKQTKNKHSHNHSTRMIQRVSQFTIFYERAWKGRLTHLWIQAETQNSPRATNKNGIHCVPNIKTGIIDCPANFTFTHLFSLVCQFIFITRGKKWWKKKNTLLGGLRFWLQCVYNINIV